MRILRALSDLPWWGGLLIFMMGNLIIPIPYIGFICGCPACLFGCWVFSKLLKPDDSAQCGRAIICVPLLVLVLWFTNVEFLDWGWGTLYTVRLSIGMLLGMCGFQGFTK